MCLPVSPHLQESLGNLSNVTQVGDRPRCPPADPEAVSVPSFPLAHDGGQAQPGPLTAAFTRTGMTFLSHALKILARTPKARTWGPRWGQSWAAGMASRLGLAVTAWRAGSGALSQARVLFGPCTCLLSLHRPPAPPASALPCAPCHPIPGSVPRTSDLQGTAHEGTLSEWLAHHLPARLPAPDCAV